jgi:polysaccharide export outer membrane protein
VPSTQTVDSSKLLLPQRIQKGDKIGITVSCPDPAQTLFLNPFNNQNTGGAGQSTGFLVNAEGQITFPLIGKILLEGLSSEEAANLITQKLKHFYKDPYVYVTLSGKVYYINSKGGGVIPIANERLTIMEAVAQIGSMDHFEKRDEVWVVREEKGERIFTQVNLNSKEIFVSPFYYLHNNDLVYIKPNRFYTIFSPNGPGRSIILGIASLLGLYFALKK